MKFQDKYNELEEEVYNWLKDKTGIFDLSESFIYISYGSNLYKQIEYLKLEDNKWWLQINSELIILFIDLDLLNQCEIIDYIESV